MYALFCNELLLLISRSQIFCTNWLKWAAILQNLHNLPTKLFRSFIFNHAISWEMNSNSENKWPLHCGPFGIYYFKVAYEAQVHKLMTQELRTQMQPTDPWCFVKFIHKTIRSWFIFILNQTKCECWQHFLFFGHKKRQKLGCTFKKQGNKRRNIF